LRERGTVKDWEKCGEWIEDGETVTYDPCPPRRQLAPSPPPWPPATP
jgi:hypothetical protein